MTISAYQYYNRVFKNLPLPIAYCDLDMLDKNIDDIADRIADSKKKIRIASKSVRCTFILKRILERNPVYKGIMCYTAAEALFLLEQGFDDLLLGYPIVNTLEIQEVCKQNLNGKKVYLMVDCEMHLQQINRIAADSGIIQPVCIDIDMSTDFPGLHFGVIRSPLTTIEKAKAFIDSFEKYPNISIAGVMGYEAQVAGLGEKNPANGIKNIVIPFLKKKSIADYSKRRKEIVAYLLSKNYVPEFVNAGGTGSIESSIQEDWVTEITVGSGFYAPALFDYYEAFKHQPALGFALQIVRKPKDNFYTCLGGGYIGSGGIGIDKQPKPYLPEGVVLTINEGCGEVQTPIEYNGTESIGIGDTVLFRHSKAGELCERFNNLYLIDDGKIINQVPTYRGQGQCFL